MFAQNLCPCTYVCAYMYATPSFCDRMCVLRSNINTFIINERPLRPRAQNAYAKATARSPKTSPPPTPPGHVCVFVYAFCGWQHLSFAIRHLPLGATSSGSVLVMSTDHRPGGLSQYQSPPVHHQLLIPSSPGVEVSVSNCEKSTEINKSKLRDGQILWWSNASESAC